MQYGFQLSESWMNGKLDRIWKEPTKTSSISDTIIITQSRVEPSIPRLQTKSFKFTLVSSVLEMQVRGERQRDTESAVFT
jgi:hypothetical protein